MKILVTGGAGFIGSHLIDRLLAERHSVVCVDNLSLGRISNISRHIGKNNFRLVKLNLLEKGKLGRIFSSGGFECVFHMAANSDIRKGGKYLKVDLEDTFLTTFSLLECMKKGAVRQLVFASSSAIYGDNRSLLGEETGPLRPVSFYGAAKLAAEAYISASCANFGLRAWIIRFPNVIGERATHGVMYDFVNKLRRNPGRLEILGNGKQKKPYVYVKDLVDGILFSWKHSRGSLNCFNLGVNSATTVDEIARIVADEMGLDKVEFVHTGGETGWVGDVPVFRYDLSKITRLGWKAEKSSTGAVRRAVRAYLGKAWK